MSSRVVILDYGLGNVFSVERAFEYVGVSTLLTCDPAEVAAADYLVLPGVGAFASGMKELTQRELIAPLREYACSGKPLLGICLGMQLLFSASEEFGLHDGLDIIHGRVSVIPSIAQNGARIRVPHVGWAELRPAPGASWGDTMLCGVELGQSVYFVHSFRAIPENPAHRLADTYYFDYAIPAVIRSGNIVGCQFHPEKSGETGLQILKNFMEL